MQTQKKGDTEREEGPNNSDDSDGGPPELLPTQPSQKEMKKSRLWGVAASREEDSRSHHYHFSDVFSFLDAKTIFSAL